MIHFIILSRDIISIDDEWSKLLNERHGPTQRNWTTDVTINLSARLEVFPQAMNMMSLRETQKEINHPHGGEFLLAWAGWIIPCCLLRNEYCLSLHQVVHWYQCLEWTPPDSCCWHMDSYSQTWKHSFAFFWQLQLMTDLLRYLSQLPLWTYYWKIRNTPLTSSFLSQIMLEQGTMIPLILQALGGILKTNNEHNLLHSLHIDSHFWAWYFDVSDWRRQGKNMLLTQNFVGTQNSLTKAKREEKINELKKWESRTRGQLLF